MAKNQLVKGSGKKQFLEVSTILQNDEMRAKLQNFVDEVLLEKSAILDKQESIKVLRERAVETLNIEPKMFNNIVSLYFNNNFEQKADELEKLTQVIELLTAGK
jgi:vesicle coat complex subunit